MVPAGYRGKSGNGCTCMTDQIFGLSRREVTELLRSKGINPTTQRVEIAHFLLKKPRHISADEIFHRLNEEYELVSQATIYNTLRLFVERGVVRELLVSPDRVYYDSNISEHHHFIDIDTGEILDLPVDAVEQVWLDSLDADVVDVSLIVKGKLKTPVVEEQLTTTT